LEEKDKTSNFVIRLPAHYCNWRKKKNEKKKKQTNKKKPYPKNTEEG